MTALTQRLDRSIVIHATPEAVFRFFTDDARWASWWGAGSTIDARPGGRVYIRHPNGVEASGEIVEIDPPRRVVFTYGYASGDPLPVGASLVTIEVEKHERGAQVHLWHEFSDVGARDHHVQGWRFQLSLFANVVANEVNASAAERVDGWFAAWAEPDAATRTRALSALAADGVEFRDRFSTLTGLDDVLPHITAAQHFMPGMRLERRGDVRHCQGTVVADWEAVSADGQPRGQGTNVFIFDAMGKMQSVTGLWK